MEVQSIFLSNNVNYNYIVKYIPKTCSETNAEKTGTALVIDIIKKKLCFRINSFKAFTIMF